MSSVLSPSRLTFCRIALLLQCNTHSVRAIKSSLGTLCTSKNQLCCGWITSGKWEMTMTKGLSNIKAVRCSVVQSHRYSACKLVTALGMSNCSVCHILYEELHFHPYKMVVDQELQQQDWNNHILLEAVPHGIIVAYIDEVHFHIYGCVNQ
ncbi:hypothetical protein PR048_008617 [Dryococelus australis]|uniref:Uncharacterized protein n=1 Tax=Dryococelus australis TaxID=614101 RepID=A0ABQ9HXL6_9NEOP|nr:hypothetical protein PR048_008617 [Dryococelus australis]